MNNLIAHIEDSLQHRPKLILALVLLAGFIIRLLVLPNRWINPDEGAHLFDARLLLQGMIPVVDYASRQPIYTLILAGFIKIFGITLLAGRFLPLVASLGIGWMIFLIARRLYDDRVGLLSALFYLFLPYTVIWSTVVKTEMLGVFLCCLSVYLLFRALSAGSKAWVWIFVSGAVAALASYVRQPTIYLPTAVLLFLIFYTFPNKRARWQLIIWYFVAYLAVCLLVFIFYWRFLSFSQIMFSQLNPINLVWNRLAHVLGLLPQQMRVVDSEGFRILSQDMDYTMRAWRESIICSFFVLAAVVSLALQWLNRRRRHWRHSLSTNPALLLVLWPLVVILAYVFQSYISNYYSQYFLEAMPPLVILASVYILRLLDELDRPLIKTVALSLVIFFGLFLLFRVFWFWRWSSVAYFALASILSVIPIFMSLKTKMKRLPSFILMMIVLASCFFIIAIIQNKMPVFLYVFIVFSCYLFNRIKKLRPIQARLLVLAFGLIVSASYSGAIIGPQYECVWSQKTLSQIVQILHRQSKPSDTVLSGAMIWTFESGLRPFGGVTHPTIFFKKYAETFEEEFQLKRPTFIIVDGYTEKKFSRYWAFIQQELEINYYLLAEVRGSRSPVKIYRSTEVPRAAEPALADASQYPRIFIP